MVGKDNVVADMLSRMWACSVSTMFTIYKDWINDIQEEYMLDEHVVQILQKL